MTTNDYILKLYGYLRLCYKISLVTLHWGFSSIPALYLRWPLEAGRENGHKPNDSPQQTLLCSAVL